MKRLTSIIFAMAISFATIASAANPFDLGNTKGNGNIVKKEIRIKDYQEFSFGGSATIVYEQKEDANPYLRIEIDENIFPLLEVESQNGKLKISGKNIAPTKYVIYTNSSSLSLLDLSGSVNYTIKGKSVANTLTIKTAGTTTLNGDNLTYESILVHTAGSCKIALGGETKKISCNSNGNGCVNMIKLKSDEARCSTAGSGDIKVHAEKSLEVKIAGSGKVEYKGSPEINKRIAGSGTIFRVKS
ncbi:GIN domain-containing protein [Dysgonomonas sp. 25]|uniref:GIN domain-containing protein n=1 Tax=Dysgonomonas sp. 25 TaxID=2302933 RepID=UPI0013D6F963|nr:DUF2807 domain-containing protein [Dysgonomonas sp. 25]NDV68180.1 DUF2807 domain-containing protein [Dysgonomonas sp. 25]